MVLVPEVDQTTAAVSTSPGGADSRAVPCTFRAKDCWNTGPSSEPETSSKGYQEKPGGPVSALQKLCVSSAQWMHRALWGLRHS